MFIMETTFAYVGTAASIVGLVVAAIQSVRARQLRRYADHLERIRRVNVWAFIGMTLEAFDTLDELREIEIAECNEAQIAAKIASARRSAGMQYLQLLKEAVLSEPDFTNETVDLWAENGRLENEWRVRQARKLADLGSLSLKGETP